MKRDHVSSKGAESALYVYFAAVLATVRQLFTPVLLNFEALSVSTVHNSQVEGVKGLCNLESSDH